MLDRLYASLTSGPSLNARPHSSRQRMDVMELRHLKGTDPAQLIQALLKVKGPVELPAQVPIFHKPEAPETEWTEEQKRAKAAHDKQGRVLNKLRDIAQDANDYYNDHGEQALFIGFPLVSIPSRSDKVGMTSRILAPALLMPINIRVRRGAGAGVTVEPTGDGADLLQPNPGLLAWIEQQTGHNTEELFSDEAAEDPWREVSEVIGLIKQAANLSGPTSFGIEDSLVATPRTDELPNDPSILKSAVIGLFPLHNPGLLRDTKWMQENEADLTGPVKAFLSAEALAQPEDRAITPAEEYDPALDEHGRKEFAEELLITHADPCQTEAVHHARNSQALVVHGPPGTGKSQTIANIIGDHLARGQRVLFVCDKRTALDVVRYRLDSMGLGMLCGTVHDAQRDRKGLYLGIRERMEQLADEKPFPDPQAQLALTNERLNLLHQELQSYFERLHGSGSSEGSFHALCGAWLELHASETSTLTTGDGLTMEMVERHRTDIEEITKRAIKCQWPKNPYRGILGIVLNDYLSRPAESWTDTWKKALEMASVLDQGNTNQNMPIGGPTPLPELAQVRKELALMLEKVLVEAPLECTGPFARASDKAAVAQIVGQAQAHLPLLESPLDRELLLHTNGQLPLLTDCNQCLNKVKEWRKVSKGWKRWFSGKVKHEAKEALATIGLGLDSADLERGNKFLQGVRARHLITDLYRQWSTTEALQPEDAVLARFLKGSPVLFQVLSLLDQPAHADIKDRILGMLHDTDRANDDILLEQLEASAERAMRLHELFQLINQQHVLQEAYLQLELAKWRNGEPISAWANQMDRYAPTVEEALRMLDRLNSLPGPLQEVMNEVNALGLTFDLAEPAIKKAALYFSITGLLRNNPDLARIDTERIEAAFSELSARTHEKTGLVRDKILHHWQGRWRSRLLASTGSRLNNLGASLRQRLYVRGQKAMKLRQMIQSGGNTPGGDPLFDLCPVWMASPATVAQVFPREAIFDVIVFDEASQCRLEEALPVLLRGKRVVIAGDPKQLPPTRFFEGALAESDDTDAESATELFIARQAEAEDLLSSALNLNVQESFLDVHYRSRNEALIGFSNDSFYGSRLQPIPGHPGNKLMQTPIALTHVGGTYMDRTNPKEAEAVVGLVDELLRLAEPPSIGIACFNITQRDVILDALDQKAAADPDFANRLEAARKRKGRDSFEGLFVKNLENVQGDERDHMIICTTFGPDKDGKFRRNFGALSRAGGERRLNVLVTRARDMVHIFTSIPRPEYVSPAPLTDGQRMTGRHYLYGYLRYAEYLDGIFEKWRQEVNALHGEAMTSTEINQSSYPSQVAEGVGNWLSNKYGIGNRVYWGNDGFCVDVALTHPGHPADVTIGVLTDFTRYAKTPDPISWELFRSAVLHSQGWQLQRVWTPALFKNPVKQIDEIKTVHQEMAMRTQLN